MVFSSFVRSIGQRGGKFLNGARDTVNKGFSYLNTTLLPSLKHGNRLLQATHSTIKDDPMYHSKIKKGLGKLANFSDLGLSTIDQGLATINKIGSVVRA